MPAHPLEKPEEIYEIGDLMMPGAKKIEIGSKREMSRGKKKKLSIQETGKCMQINRSIFNPETFFHSSIFKQKCKPRSLSPAQGKNSSSMRKSPSSQRVYRRRQSVSEGAGCDEAEGDSTYLQKSHNICSYRSR